MANLDIKGEFLSGSGLKILAKVMKSRALAIGHVVEFWEIAQEYWARGELVPKATFEAMGFPGALMDPAVGVAEWRDGGVYARGAERYFQWLQDRREAGRRGGIASGKARKTKANEFNADAEAKAEAQEPPIPSPIPSPIPKEEESFSKKPTLHKLALLWNTYKAPEMTEVRKCGLERMRAAEELWKDEPSEKYWTDVIKKAAASPLACGKGTSKWIMDFDFFLRSDTANRILEGKYELRFQNAPKKISALAQQLQEAQHGDDQK